MYGANSPPNRTIHNAAYGVVADASWNTLFRAAVTGTLRVPNE